MSAQSETTPVKEVILLSEDDKTIKVKKEIAMLSGLIKNIIEDIGDSGTPEEDIIPLPAVCGKVLKKVMELCTLNYDAQQENNRSVMDEWNEEFMPVYGQELIDIIKAANYLDIKPLLDIGCKSIANMIKGKSSEEIRRTFNITNDFTPEEEAQIKKENEWASQIE